MTTRTYRAPRYHYPRFDTSICPNPEACAHTTEIPGESCECCGGVIPDAATKPRTSQRDRELYEEAINSSAISHGWTLAHDLPDMLAEGPGSNYRWACAAYAQDEAREHVRQFARWLLAVADDAS